MTHQHSYWIRHPRGFGNEYTIMSIPSGKGPLKPTGGDTGWQKLTRDQALKHARETWPKHQVAHVTVDPCPCGDCALSQYADQHPHSAIANRVKFTQGLPRQARAQQRDAAILGTDSDEYRARWDPYYEPKESVA